MEPYLTINEAAVLTKFAVATLRKYVLRHEIPFHKKFGAIRFRASELDRWMAEENAGEAETGNAEQNRGTGQMELALEDRS